MAELPKWTVEIKGTDLTEALQPFAEAVDAFTERLTRLEEADRTNSDMIHLLAQRVDELEERATAVDGEIRNILRNALKSR